MARVESGAEVDEGGRHMRITAIAVATFAVSVVGCTTDLAPPPEPPVLTVTAPERGLMQAGLSSVQVMGTVAPGPSGARVEAVVVNGVPADVAPDGRWSAFVPLRSGVNFVETRATAADGGAADDTRGVITGRF